MTWRVKNITKNRKTTITIAIAETFIPEMASIATRFLTLTVIKMAIKLQMVINKDITVQMVTII